MENSSSILNNSYRYRTNTRVLYNPVIANGLYTKRQYAARIPAHFKLFLVILVVLLSIYSGIFQLTNENQSKPVFIRQVTALSLAKQRRVPQRFISSMEQVKVIGFTQAKALRPTPIAQSAQSVKSASTATSIYISNPQAEAPHVQNAYLDALNSYRQKHGQAALQWDTKLAQFAQERADLFSRNGGLDQHAGFQDLISHDGFTKMGFMKLGENSSFGTSMDPVQLFESAYANSPAHNSSQLSSDWTYVGIGISGSASDVIFGGRKQ